MPRQNTSILNTCSSILSMRSVEPISIVAMLLLMILGLPAKASEVRADRLSEDVYVSKASPAFETARHHTWTVPQDLPLTRAQCEANIQKAVCSTTARADEISAQWDQLTCAADSKTFVVDVMALYDEMPERMRPSLCTLEKIFISDGILSTAFASPIENSAGKIIGGYIGIRKSTFLNQPDSLTLMSWKEQLPFGGSTQFLQVNPNLVHLNYGVKLDHLSHDGLFYVISHELGHLIDFDNGINSNYRGGTPAASWQSLSWHSVRSPIAASMYKDQQNFCYYDCDSYLQPSTALSIYQSLAQSAFITTYSGTNSLEDFAEYWAWYQLLNFKFANFVIDIPGEGQVDMTAAAKSNPNIMRKLNFVGQIWNNSSLKIAH